MTLILPKIKEDSEVRTISNIIFLPPNMKHKITLGLIQSINRELRAGKLTKDVDQHQHQQLQEQR